MLADTLLNKDFSGKVAVIGDVMLDRYIHGKISRISPEAPVPVFQHHRTSETAGGAANVAANVASLGGRVSLLGIVGADEGQQSLAELMRAYGVPDVTLMTVSDRTTTCKTRFVSGGQQVMRYDEEQTQPVAAHDLDRLLDLARSILIDAKVLIISDYGKGLITSQSAPALIGLAKEMSVPVIVDPKGKDYAKYKGATTLTPNLKELQEAVGRPLQTDEDVATAGQELIRTLGLEYVLSTRSEQGMSVVSTDAALHIPTYAREVFDVSGAGDTVVGAFGLGIANGMDKADAAFMANAAAGVAVSKRGTARVSMGELKKELQLSHPGASVASAALTLEEAIETVERWRMEGESVGFTNGCFDILHFGHTSILGRARSHCDRLIVGLNSDASVRRLKGETRPVNTVQDRASVLASLRAVDAVVVFDEDTPLELIEALRPDMLFKGADYSEDTVVGAPFVKSIGGKVIILDLEDGRSTTNLIHKVSGGQ